MKKMLLFAVACMTAMLTYADVELKDGSVVDLKSSEARTIVTWDYKNMLIEGKTVKAFLAEKGADWQKDYPAEVSASEGAFAAYFNKKCKKFVQVTNDKGASQYDFVIHVKNFNYGSTAAAVMFGGYSRGASMDGTVDIVSKATKKVIATVSFDCSGKAAYGNEQRRILVYQDFAKDFAKLIAKSK